MGRGEGVSGSSAGHRRDRLPGAMAFCDWYPDRFRQAPVFRDSVIDSYSEIPEKLLSCAEQRVLGWTAGRGVAGSPILLLERDADSL
jgi:hypothetical protein